MAEETTEWGDPNPAGLFAVGAGTTAVWASLTGQVGPQDLPVLIVWLLAAGLVQTIVGVILFRRGDPLGGSLNLAFGILFFGAPAVTMALSLSAASAAGQPSMTLMMNGWVFFVLGLVLVSYIPIMARQSVLSMAALVVFSCAVVLLALLNIRPPAEQAVAPWPTVAATAGWLIGGAGLAMVYLGIATALAYGFEREVLPIPGPVTSPASGPIAAPLSQDP